MKYNRTLDLLCAAVTYRRDGKLTAAAKCFEAASKDPSARTALQIVESFNASAHRQLVRSSRLRSGTDEVGELDEDVGNELKIEPNENGDRIVQEADFDDMDDMEDEDVEASSRHVRAGAAIRAMSKDEIRTIRAKMLDYGFKFSGRTLTKETDAPYMVFSKKGTVLKLSGKLVGDTMTTTLDVTGDEDEADTKAAVKFLKKYVGKQKVSSSVDDMEDEDCDDVEAAFGGSKRNTASSDFSRALKNLHALK